MRKIGWTVASLFLANWHCGTIQAEAGNFFQSAVRLEDFDLLASRSFKNGEPSPVAGDVLTALIDMAGAAANWSAGSPPRDWKSEQFDYRLAFKQEVELGWMSVSLNLQYSESPLFYFLKPQAGYPGDPRKDSDWEKIRVSRKHERFEFTFPPGFKTRTLLCRQTKRMAPSVLFHWRLLKNRLHDMTPYAIAQGERAPYGWDPQNIPRGGNWQNTGPDQEQRIFRAPVSNINPSWFILNWTEPQTPVAIRFRTNIEKFRVYAFQGAASANPALAARDSWERIRVNVVRKSNDGNSLSHFLTFKDPIKTRALKFLLRETKPRESQIARISELIAWTDLKDQPVPGPPEADPPPPFGISFEMEQDGEVAFVIDDMNGRRVRNLFAQVTRKSGANLARWDLKNMYRRPVKAGRYRWKAIYAPTLELHYQLTPYPNVELHSPNNRPWNGRSQDGWLANHANLTDVCAIGDRLYIAAGGTEGGHAFIESDLAGQKLWGSAMGAHRLFSDGKNLYLMQGGQIRHFDPETRKVRDLLGTGENPARKGILVGWAAHGGKVYLAFHGPAPYFTNATPSASLAEIENCLPKLQRSIKGGENYGYPATPQQDFLNIFRLTGHISGLTFNGATPFLETTEGYARRQNILLAFKKPIPLGSLTFPRHEDPSLTLKISILKKGSPWPPRVRKKEDWQDLPLKDLAPWNVIAAPENTFTRALRITFTQPGDELDAIEDDGPDPDKPNLADFSLEGEAEEDNHLAGNKKKAWKAKIGGIRLLRRRFRSLLPGAKIRVNSGKVDPKTGEWKADSKEVISRKNPGIYVVEWNSPKPVMGIAFMEVDGEVCEIDAYKGPDGGTIDITGARHWEHVATYHQKRRSWAHHSSAMNFEARYIDGFASFEQETKTRAIRLRITRSFTARGSAVVRPDRGGGAIDPKRCAVWGAAPVQYLGGEPSTDSLITRRLQIHNAETGKLEKEMASDIRGRIQFNSKGELFGIRKGGVVRINRNTLEQTEHIRDPNLKGPRLLSFGPKGRLYVYDHAPGQRVVRVYDTNGKFLHLIGTRGERKAGLWNPTKLSDIVGMTVDKNESVWLVYPHENPRRVIQFKTDGTYVKELLGNTHYGGDGTLDRYDKSRVYYKDVVFKVDWEKGTSRIHSLLSTKYWEASPWSDPFRSCMVPIKIEDRKYMVNVPLSHNYRQPMGVVYLYNPTTFTIRMCAAFGAAGAFRYLKTPDILETLGGKPIGQFRFIWTDRNGDGILQVKEVIFKPKGIFSGVARFDRSLAAMGGKLRYEVNRFLPDGTPVYKEIEMPFPAIYRMNNGNFLRFGQNGNEMFTPAGELLWRYPATYDVSGLWIPGWSPGHVTNQFGLSGHERADTGDLGEFFVVHSNTGQMNIWTVDGLLAGHVTYHTRDPRRTGWGSKFARGSRIDRLTLGQEHFHHFFCKTEEDGNYYIVAGGNHLSLVEVKGLEKFKRLQGEFEITRDIFQKTQDWEAKRIRKEVFARAQLIECAPYLKTPTIDGSAGGKEWGPPKSEATISHPFSKFWMGYDPSYLYLCWQTNGAGPFRNIGDDYHRFFKTGGAVDLKLGTDPDADPHRSKPTKGDIRLLIARVDDKPQAVLYRPVAPDAEKGDKWETSTPAGGTTKFDEVKVLKDVWIASSSGENSFTVEARIPLKTLGLKIQKGMLLKMDWGILSTDEGNLTKARDYWANRKAVGTTDEPTEARLEPNLWGNVRFIESRKSGLLDPGELLDESSDVEDLLEDLDKTD